MLRYGLLCVAGVEDGSIFSNAFDTLSPRRKMVEVQGVFERQSVGKSQLRRTVHETNRIPARKPEHSRSVRFQNCIALRKAAQNRDDRSCGEMVHRRAALQPCIEQQLL